MQRISYDTSIKHLVRNGVLNDILTPDQIALIPSSNISRWKNETDDKYQFCELNSIIREELEFIKRFNSSSRIKKINQSYFKLVDTFHEVISNIKGIKSIVKQQKEYVVNSIEKVKDYIPIEKALKVFNISRSTFEHYKSILIYKCDTSYFNWCSRRIPNQLLPKEVTTIKKYMKDDRYKHWSKASIYLKALRNGDLKCGVTTFYKYCLLLGFKNKPRKRKSDYYNPIKTNKPNELWCADVTIFKTDDNTKQYVHFLMDHFSKMILGYQVSKSPSATIIKELLENAYSTHKPDKVLFLTDGGSENVNTTVSRFVDITGTIDHIIAQKDVAFSNSMIEALNKTIKHQFLYHHQITNREQLNRILKEAVLIYNAERPQMSLGGNTPIETFNGQTIDLSTYTNRFKAQKALRKQQNKQYPCTICQ